MRTWDCHDMTLSSGYKFHTPLYSISLSHLCVIAYTFEYEISEIMCADKTYLSVNQNQL